MIGETKIRKHFTVNAAILPLDLEAHRAQQPAGRGDHLELRQSVLQLGDGQGESLPHHLQTGQVFNGCAADATAGSHSKYWRAEKTWVGREAGPPLGKTPSGLTPTRAVFYAAPPGASSARFGPNSVAALQRLQVLPGKTWRELARRTCPKYLSAMIQAADIEQMGMHERLQTMELLWASLVGTPEAVPSPAWHGEVVASRLAKMERGEGEFLTLGELQDRLRRRTS